MRSRALLLPLLLFAFTGLRGQIVTGPWVGGVLHDSAVIVAELNSQRLPSLEVSEDPAFSRSRTFSDLPARPGSTPGILRFAARGLKPSTTYHYRIRAGGVWEGSTRGTFTTLPVPGTPASFTFAFSSCARSGSNHPVFAEIHSHNPLFFLHLGDLHYEDIDRNDKTAFLDAFRTALRAPNQAELYRTIPLVYVWDDHDFGANNADASSPSLPAAHAAFREFVPHHPLAFPNDPTAPLCRAFTAGRTRFLVLDTRTERSPAGDPDGPAKTLLGIRQLEWLKAELLAARGRFPLIFIASSISWTSADSGRRDNWGRYAHERAALAAWMAENGVTGVCFLGGDAHMLAADDGRHSAYAPASSTGFPALQAAPLDQTASVKGGPWSVGPITPGDNEGFFGKVTVTDAGERLSVLFQGLNQDGTEKLRLAFEVPAPAP